LIRQLHADLLLMSAYAGPNSSLRSRLLPRNIYLMRLACTPRSAQYSPMATPASPMA
jgi:hypothetical protein